MSPVPRGNRKLMNEPSTTSLPAIGSGKAPQPIQSEEEKQRLREQLENDYFK